MGGDYLELERGDPEQFLQQAEGDTTGVPGAPARSRYYKNGGQFTWAPCYVLGCDSLYYSPRSPWNKDHIVTNMLKQGWPIRWVKKKYAYYTTYYMYYTIILRIIRRIIRSVLYYVFVLANLVLKWVNNMTSFYRSSRANNGKDALNTPGLSG